MARALREVVFVDGVRTAFGKAGPGGWFWRTRGDDMAVKAVRELLRRNPGVPPERVGDVALAATAQVGDQGLTLGRDVALLAGLPQTVPGFAVDRMCAGALTAAKPNAKLLRQVHEGLLFEGPGKELDKTRDVTRKIMEGAASLTVPLVVDTGVGDNWAAAH